MIERKIISLLGLAQRAGKLLSGEAAILSRIASGQIQCIIIAADAADNTREHYQESALNHGIPCFKALSKLELSQGIGKPERAAVAITDSGLAQALAKLLSEEL